MAVRLASDTIRTLYAIQCITKEMKHQSQTPVYKNKTQDLCKVEVRQISTNNKSSSNSASSSPPTPPSENADRSERQRTNPSNETALVHKVHRNDRPLRNNVPERAKCDELDDILAKWNVGK
ncbi:uncharacterized protein LOC143209092 isoform X2 [Lasioglossum baleicum]|uniref:uncharacterized protein LOC143209092 isoform X2 n=1 Tax=Lasioglossum baleicum TaxID=434251 RepID=UPI003FCCAD05